MHFFDTFSTTEPPKVVRAWCVLYILTSKCASRHNGVHFFDIWTSQKWSETRQFLTLLTWKSASRQQRRALFRHLNFQKWSERGVFCTFWLGNLLRATTACTFSTSQLPRVVRSSSVLVHFDLGMCFAPHTAWTFSCLIWPAGSAPAAISEPTFRPSGATNHWKNTSESRLSYLVAHLHLLSSDLVSYDSSHLCFSTVHIVGSFTSKLGSINQLSYLGVPHWADKTLWISPVNTGSLGHVCCHKWKMNMNCSPVIKHG